MTTDKAQLRRLALAATPGPWSTLQRGRYWHDEEADVVDADDCEVLGVEFVKPIGDVYTTRGQVYADDATYVAAANPAVVLALLDEIEALRADAARYRWLRDLNSPRAAQYPHRVTLRLPFGWAGPEGLDKAIDNAIQASIPTQAGEPT